MTELAIASSFYLFI